MPNKMRKDWKLKPDGKADVPRPQTQVVYVGQIETWSKVMQISKKK